MTPAELAAWRHHIRRYPPIEILLPILMTIMSGDSKTAPHHFAPGLYVAPKRKTGTLEADTMKAILDAKS